MQNFSPKQLYSPNESINLYEISSGALKEWPEPFKYRDRQYIGYIQTSSMAINTFINDSITSNNIHFIVREEIFEMIKEEPILITEISDILKGAKTRSLVCILTLLLQCSYIQTIKDSMLDSEIVETTEQHTESPSLIVETLAKHVLSQLYEDDDKIKELVYKSSAKDQMYYWRRGNKFMQFECENMLLKKLMIDESYSETIKVAGGNILLTTLLYKGKLSLSLLPSNAYPLSSNILKSLFMLFGPKLIGDIWNANNVPKIRAMLIAFIQSFDFTLEEYNILVTMAGLSLLVKLFSSSNTMIKAKTNQVLQQVTLDRATSEVILNYCGSNYYIGLLYNKNKEGLSIPVSLLIEREWDPTEIVEIDRYLLSKDILNTTNLDLSCIYIYIILLIYLDRRVNNNVMNQLATFFHFFVSVDTIDLSRILIYIYNNR